MIETQFLPRTLSRHIVLLMCLLLAGCGPSASTNSEAGNPSAGGNEATNASSTDTAARQESTPSRHVTLLAAASTTEAIEEIARLFEKSHGVPIKVSTGPSSGLAQQIIAGAPADVFISANEQWGHAIEEQGLAVERQPLLANRIVLIVPKGNPAQVSTPDDLKSASVKRIALAGERVPAGIYADQALQNLSLLQPLTESGKVVRGHDVRVTLGYVEQGEAEAGVVYSTDAKLSERVEVVYTFPAETHEPVRYPALLLKHEGISPAAKEFFEFLFSDQAGDVFEKYGFARVASPADDSGGSP
ncbi:molybdate ABC transporter substrate-binding protein [bacterium]|nr:molybdate ABC transporter substrate-binding protein [bacterium]